jgi:hypothetical protein
MYPLAIERAYAGAWLIPDLCDKGMFHFLSKVLSSLFERMRTTIHFPENLTNFLMSARVKQMKDLDKTIADAQAFINSMKEFNGTSKEGNDEHVGSDIHSTGDRPIGGTDHSLQGNLKQDEGVGLSEISTNLPSLTGSSNRDHNDTGRTAPVGRKNGFGTINFSRKSDYEQPFRADLLTFIEVYYYENKKLPLVHELHEAFHSHPDRPNFLKGWNAILDDISDSLKNRGIKPYNTVDNYIDPKFAWATSLIVNELKNIYRPETQSAVQMVSLVLTAVMEILAQNVTSDVLNRVAAEIRSSPSVRKVIEAQST